MWVIAIGLLSGLIVPIILAIFDKSDKKPECGDNAAGYVPNYRNDSYNWGAEIAAMNNADHAEQPAQSNINDSADATCYD